MIKLIFFLILRVKADITKSWGHRIIQDGRYIRRFVVQPPAQAGSTVSSDQVVQGFVQSGIENIDAINHATCLGNLCHCLVVLIAKRVFPTLRQIIKQKSPREEEFTVCYSFHNFFFL